MKIGIPKAMYYYYFNKRWQYFFEYLGIEIVESGETNRAIIESGNVNDEMCLSLKIYLGHVKELIDKCDYILIPRIENYGVTNQMCSNYLSLYDLVNSLFDVKTLSFSIDHLNKETELKGFIKIGKILNIPAKKIKKAYYCAYNKEKQIIKLENILNYNKLKSMRKKILLIAHSYNLNDNSIGIPVINLLKTLDCEVIMGDRFDSKITEELANKISRDIYWKYSKKLLGAIVLCETKVDGIIFLSTFPCGLDSLVNELAIKKIKLPYLNIIIDDLDSFSGIETRIESFVDILEQV